MSIIYPYLYDVNIYIIISPTHMSHATKLNGYQLWLSSQYWQRSFNQLLKPSDITHAQYMVLNYMVWADKKGKLAKLSQNQLSQELSLDAMMISNVLKALEAKKYVTRMPAEKNELPKKTSTKNENTSEKPLKKATTPSGNVLSTTKEWKELIKSLAHVVENFEEQVFAKTNKKFRKWLESIVDQLSD